MSNEERKPADVIDLARERIKRQPVQPECPDEEPLYVVVKADGTEINVTEQLLFDLAQRGAEGEDRFTIRVHGHDMLVTEDRLFELASLGAALADNDGGGDAA